MNFTPAQEKVLGRLAREPYVTKTGGGGLGKAAWERMMARLVRAGIAEPYPHGGYGITESGRKAHAELVAHLESEAARFLGNANEEREKGNAFAAARWDRAAQAALDRANDLRGNGATP